MTGFHTPEYQEVRIWLTDADQFLEEYVGSRGQINYGETIRIMLKDFFYGEFETTLFPHQTMHDRTIVFNTGPGSYPIPNLLQAFEALGDVFWHIADTITERVLKLTPYYTYKPSECFYKFFPDTRALVVYLPVLDSVVCNPLVRPLNGHAVVLTCSEFLPSWAKAKPPSTL